MLEWCLDNITDNHKAPHSWGFMIVGWWVDIYHYYYLLGLNSLGCNGLKTFLEGSITKWLLDFIHGVDVLKKDL